MESFTITEAGKNWFSIMDRVTRGETFAVTVGRWRKPVAYITPVTNKDETTGGEGASFKSPL